MPRMIYAKDSTAMHLRMGRRHVRLCGRTPGAEQFAAAIRPVLESLAEKECERKAADEAREEAYDEVVRCDFLLDNTVRTTFERVGQYDREHLTRTCDLLFPDHGYSSITNKPFSEEPQAVNNLLEIMDGLPEGHPLKELIDPMREKMEAAAEAWDAYQGAIVHLSAVIAREEHERLAVRQQYEYNWLDARKQYGAFMAKGIFPKVKSRVSSPKQDADGQNTPESD